MPAVLLDIEGTTTSIGFVYDVLFPYAVQALPGFLATHRTDQAVREAMLMVLADATPADKGASEVETVLAVVRRQMAADVKATGLKQLQGLVWNAGYAAGKIKGHLYPDVPARLKAWHAEGRTIAIYSSGSRLAQQLLFKHSEAGDLSGLINAYFDTTAGPKREAGSYASIAAKLGLLPGEVVFCTDQPAEAQAAHAAGLHAKLIMRPGNAPLPAHQAFEIHADFGKI